METTTGNGRNKALDAALETMERRKSTVVDEALEAYTGVLHRHITRMEGDWGIPWLEAGRQWPRGIWGDEHSCGNALVLMMLTQENGWRLPDFVPTEWMPERMQDKWHTLDDCLVREKPRGEGKGFPLLYDTTGSAYWGGSDWESPFKDEYFAYDEKEQAMHLTEEARTWLARCPVYCIEGTNIMRAHPRTYAACVGAWYAEWRSDAAARRLALLDRMIEGERWLCKINQGHDGEAYYNIRTDEITVPEKGMFADKGTFYGILLHELVHSTGADDRRGRFRDEKGWGMTDCYYAREELIAELAAALIANRMGLAKHLKDDSASYLHSWLHALETQDCFLAGVLVEVERACRIVFSRLAAMA